MPIWRLCLPTNPLVVNLTCVCLPPFRTEAGPPESPWQASTPLTDEWLISNREKARKEKEREPGVKPQICEGYTLYIPASFFLHSALEISLIWEKGKLYSSFCHLCLTKTVVFFGHTIDAPCIRTPTNPPILCLSGNICDPLPFLPKTSCDQSTLVEHRQLLITNYQPMSNDRQALSKTTQSSCSPCPNPLLLHSPQQGSSALPSKRKVFLYGRTQTCSW